MSTITPSAPAPSEAPQEQLEQGTLLTPNLDVNPEALALRHDWSPETQMAVDAARKILKENQAAIPPEKKPRMTP